MSASDLLDLPDTLGGVAEDQETTGQRVRRLRKELGWTQKNLVAASSVSEATISNIERDKPAAKGERDSVPDVLRALEAERQRRLGEQGPDQDALLMEFLARRDLEDVRMRRVGRHRKVRWLQVAIPDPDATEQEIQEDLEDFHRQQRRGDRPNG